MMRPLAWEPPCAEGAALEKAKRQKKERKEKRNKTNRQHFRGFYKLTVQRGHRELFWVMAIIYVINIKVATQLYTFAKVHTTEHQGLILLLINHSTTNLTLKGEKKKKKNFVIRTCGLRHRHHCSFGSGKMGE